LCDVSFFLLFFLSVVGGGGVQSQSVQLGREENKNLVFSRELFHDSLVVRLIA